MHEFIVENRDRILARTEDIVGRHVDRGAGAAPVLGTLPSFLDEIAGALAAGTFEPDDSISGERSIAAATQGVDRYRAGFEPAMVVRCFGALCDSIAALAEPHHICFDARELRILNQAVDSGIAWAMDAYSSAQREQEHATAAERIGVLAHELRNALSVATVGFGALQDGHVGMSSRTARTVARGLARMRSLIDQTLAAAKLQAGAALTLDHHDVAAVVREVTESVNRDVVDVAVAIDGDADLAVVADRTLLTSAIGNVVQNAMKYTRRGGRVIVRVGARDDDVVIDVEDECGGLPEGSVAALFQPFQRRHRDDGGVGLGLAIVLDAVQAHGGTVEVRDRAPHGCTFTLVWPRAPRETAQ